MAFRNLQLTHGFVTLREPHRVIVFLWVYSSIRGPLFCFTGERGKGGHPGPLLSPSTHRFPGLEKKKCTYSCSLSEQVTCCKIVLEHSEHCALENGSLLSAGIVLLGFCFVLFFMLKRFFIIVFSNYTDEGTTNSFSLHDPTESWSIHVQRKLFELSPQRLPSKETELCKLNFLCSRKVVNQVTSSSDFL